MKKLPFFIFLLPLLYPSLSLAQKFTISGYVKDASSGESLIGANIYDTNHHAGTSTNNFGFYSLTLPADSVHLLSSFVGYVPVKSDFLLTKDTTINLLLRDNELLDEVVISGTRAEEIQRVTQMSTVSVPIEQIKALPAFLGEVDVLKVLQLLPGVQSGSEGTSGLYVRGGGPDQNLILLDGVPVYNASHLFGFFSVFNSDAINNVQLIKGGFPAHYGGRLSSVIDINMKEGNNQEFHGQGSIGLVASKLTLEGPIVKDKTSFIVSGRRTYIDLLARPLIKAASDGDEVVGYYFYDLNAKINHKFSNNDRLYLSSYMGNDKFYSRYRYDEIRDNQELRSTEDVGLQWGNLTTALRWNHVSSNKLFSNTTLTYSRYRFNIYSEYEDENLNDAGEVETDYSSAGYLSGIKDFGARLDFDFIPNPNHYIRFGVHATRHIFSPGAFNVKEQYEQQTIDTIYGNRNTYATELAAYLEDDIEITDRLKVNAGLHLAGFSVNQELYTSLQPRLSARYLIDEKTSLKASYARMAQFIHLLTNSGIGLPTDLWVPATDQVKPQQSWQTAVGVARNLGDQYELSVEGYYKDMQNLIEYKEGASFLSVDRDWQSKVTAGDGYSYGAELLLQKKTGRTTGWIGYTLSKTNRQFDELNNGKEFPYKYDRRHDIGTALVFHWKEHIDLSFSWVYGTGNATTLPQAIYAGVDQGYDYYYDQPNETAFTPNTLYDYGDRNSYRMKAYHRLDAGISFTKKTRWGERSWNFSIYNIYSRKNPFYLYYDEGYSSYDYTYASKFRQVSLFPFIPSFSYNFKF